MGNRRSGLGFSDVVGHPTCPDYPGYQQRCFTTVAVNGQPDEQNYARSQGCVAINTPCTTSPGGNQGSVWCCAPGWPHTPVPGEIPPTPPTPPPPPGFQTWIRQWWFWGLVGGAGAAAFFGWKLWQQSREEHRVDVSDDYVRTPWDVPDVAPAFRRYV